MRTGFLAAVGFALVLMTGCGAEEAQPSNDGGLVIQVRSALFFNQAEVDLWRDDGTGSTSTIVLVQMGNSWLGAAEDLAPGHYLAQLKILHSSQAPPMLPVGDPVQVEILPGATAELKFLLGGDQTDPLFRGPAFTSISIPSRQIAAESTVTILVGASEGVGALTLSGSAPAQAGFFGVPNGVLSIPFTAGTVAGTFPLTLTLEDENGNADSVIFDIEVIAEGPPTPGELTVEFDLNPPPDGTISAASVFTGDDLTVNFTLSALAFGPAASGTLTWEMEVMPTAPSNTDCARGVFTVHGLESPAPLSGFTTSGATIPVTYRLERPFGTGQCDFIYRLEDSLLGTFQATYRLRLSFRSVSP